MRLRTYSTLTKAAISLLGRLIKLHRLEKKMSAQELAERAGISRTTLSSIEKGDMKTEIGLALEIANLVGIKLFDSDEISSQALSKSIEDKIALLPKRVRLKQEPIDDDF